MQTAVRSRQTEYRKGFTLVELMVVIAIIAILAALLIPAIGMARSAATKVECLSSLRQIGMAIQGYTQDNDGFVPPVVQPNPANSSWNKLWFVSLSPYAVEEDVDWDPRMPEHSIIWGCKAWTGPRHHNWKPGYGFIFWPKFEKPWPEKHHSNNGYLRGHSNPTQRQLFRDFLLEDMETPSHRAIVGDATNYMLWHHGGAKTIDFDRHGRGKTNMLFWDLHVQTVNRHNALAAVTNPHDWQD